MVAQVAATSEHMRVLDLAAAPGGKSTHLLSYMNNTPSYSVLARRLSCRMRQSSKRDFRRSNENASVWRNTGLLNMYLVSRGK